MADSIVAIWNMALANIGSTQLVNDVADTSKQAVQCAAFWPTARDLVLRAAPWPFATRWVALAQIPFTVYQPVGFAYAYAYPIDCLKAMDLWAGARQPDPQLRIPYDVVQGVVAPGGGTSRLIVTDQAPIAAVVTGTNAGTPAYPSLRYIARTTDVSVYTPDVDLAMSWRLAALLAMPMSMEKGVKQAAEQMAVAMLEHAVANAVNEGQDDYPQDSAFQLARN